MNRGSQINLRNKSSLQEISNTIPKDFRVVVKPFQGEGNLKYELACHFITIKYVSRNLRNHGFRFASPRENCHRLPQEQT